MPQTIIIINKNNIPIYFILYTRLFHSIFYIILYDIRFGRRIVAIVGISYCFGWKKNPTKFSIIIYCNRRGLFFFILFCILRTVLFYCYCSSRRRLGTSAANASRFRVYCHVRAAAATECRRRNYATVRKITYIQ